MGNYFGPFLFWSSNVASIFSNFCLLDGMKPDNQLSPDQLSQAIKHKPHIIEFLSFVFNFQGIIVGPLCFYQDYIEFINGNNILKKKV